MECTGYTGAQVLARGYVVQRIPASCKTAALQGTRELFHQAAGASGRVCLRKGKVLCRSCERQE